MVNKKKVILWDWNGTLLDDIDTCIEGINVLLDRRGIPLLTKDRYRQIFTFPVKDYYQLAGFDYSKEPFEIPAEEFMLHYKATMWKSNLFDDAYRVLSRYRILGFRQFILSAMEQNLLLTSVKERGIEQFFDRVCGISDNYAHSKVKIAKELILKNGIDPSEAILIGDTIHDAEVASEIGVDAVLVSRGHQSDERLKATGIPVFCNFTELDNILSFK